MFMLGKVMDVIKVGKFVDYMGVCLLSGVIRDIYCGSNYAFKEIDVVFIIS